ncbi:hypothetical protein IWW35_002951 [Coemansia sp. RSA 1878]|nr:hypothetical protein IWW35_002951 [Coemansia sp. RSA 1878]
MDGSNSQSNSLFNSYAATDPRGRRFSDQKCTSSQTPSAYGDSWDAGRTMNFSSPSLANPGLQSTMGTAGQQPQKEISLSLLQALLKPQPAAQTIPSSHASMQVSDSDSAGGQMSDIGLFQQPGAVSSPIEQLKRMMTAQNAAAGSSQPLYPHQQMPVAGTVPQVPAQVKPLSVNLSPHLAATLSQSSTPPSAAQTAKSGNNIKSNTPTKKRSKSQTLNVDLRRIKLKPKPETVPISLLQQPTRFRPGRLIAVSREYICYAVRSKEGGHIRVIHQLQGQLAKMQGHKDSIVDMEFHPCSRDSGMPQILASLGKDDRLIVWLVGPVDVDAATAEGAIAYEPFVNIDSGGDARFTCLAWREQIVDGAMELCVGTDRGFMVVKAPVPSPKGKRAETSNEGFNVIPIATDSAVTAIARAGLRWVIVASADKAVRIYQLDGRWESSTQPYTVVCELARGEHAIDTVIYVPPASAADGAGHVILGCSMNRVVQVWWLGASAQQAALIQTVSLSGSPTKPSPAFSGTAAKPVSAFAKLAWAEQGRCLTVGCSLAPSAIFVLRSSGHGADMHLNLPQGYALGDEQPVLSVVSALEPQSGAPASEACLSIYSVHTRLVQQLQIPGVPAVESQRVVDPTEIYANPDIVAPQLETSEAVRAPIQKHEAAVPPRPAAQAPIVPPLIQNQGGASNGPSLVQSQGPTLNGSSSVQSQRPALNGSSSVQSQGPALNGSPELVNTMAESLMALLQPQIAAEVRKADQGGSITLDAKTEERLVSRISEVVEKRVADSVALAMEQTLIPAYTRATAAMFEQMQTTFEAGLREWWLRFAQTMPPHPHAIGTPHPPHMPHPHPIATPISQMAMMPQPRGSAAPEHLPPHFTPQFTPSALPPVQASMAASGANHIDSLMSILNFSHSKAQ